MAKIKQAMYWLRKGEKVRRPQWQENSYWVLDTNTKHQRILWADGESASIHLKQLEADDWEIVEKDLSMTHEDVKELIDMLEAIKSAKVDVHLSGLINYLKK